jgi:transaldolase
LRRAGQIVASEKEVRTMADNPLKELNACGQSVWNDFIQRSFVENGDLKKLVEEDGISGVTSNPTIFQKAISSSADYDDELRQYAGEGEDAEGIFKKFASKDIGMGADVLRPVYDRTSGQDGYISIEVSPDAAHDTQKTLDDAHFYWETINRPNIMIKVPATPEGMPAIEQLISEGINVNITLIFAVEVYEEVMEAYIRGLERRAENGGSIDRIASVASFFVSRVDTLVDKLLEEKAEGADGATRDQLKQLEGKAAIANAKIAYELFEKVFGSDRFKALAAKGAHVQRPLWASTSTKNPNYEDTYYVTNLVGRDTVNTMPPETIDAVRDHGRIQCDTVVQGVDEAHRDIEALDKAGIKMTDVTSQLTREGVQKFADSLHGLFDTINGKLAEIKQSDRQPATAGSGQGGGGASAE